MNKFINKYLLVPAVAAFAFACDQDDLTGESSLTPTTPTVSIDIPNNSASFVEKDSTFEFVIELDQPQISDVAIYVKQIEGDAVEGEDFSIGTPVVVIPATRTSALASISVNADNVSEEVETFVIQIGDDRTANSNIEPKTVTFTISNYTESELPLHFSWDAEYYNAAGEELDGSDIANMILYITDENGAVLPDGPDVGTTPDGVINGAAYEDFVFTEDRPDGVYYVKAGIASSIEPGELGTAPVVDFSLDYSQVGKIAESNFTFPAAFNTAIACPENLFTMARIEKSGTNYTVTEVGEAAAAPTVPMLGTYGGVDGNIDGLGYAAPADATVALDGDTYTIDGLNQDFMVNIWGETIQTSVPVNMLIDAEGNITIEDQYIFTTLYNGNEYDYRISGTGRIIDACGTMLIEYEMNQDGFLVGAWLHENGYMTDELFTATITPN